MPGIEFVGSDADDVTDDEVLDTGPPHRFPQWVWVVAALVVVAVVAGVLVAKGSSGSHGSPDKQASSATVPAGPSAVDTGPAPQVTALTSDGSHLYWVVRNRLVQGGADGEPVASVAISPTGGDFADVQLVADPAEKVVWVVSHGASDSTGGAGNIEGFTVDGLQRVARVSARGLVNGAAVLEGALYVLSGPSLLRITAASGQLQPVARVDPSAADLVAGDQGLLYLVTGSGGVRLGSWTPSGTAVGSLRDVTDATLAFVGSNVWIAGQYATTPLLFRTSEYDGSLEQNIALGYTASEQIVATGARSLIVLGSGPGPYQYTCIDADDGTVKARARVASGLATVLRGRLYEAAAGGVQPVPLVGCPG